jgi:hypothetical protein
MSECYTEAMAAAAVAADVHKRTGIRIPWPTAKDNMDDALTTAAQLLDALGVGNFVIDEATPAVASSWRWSM